MEMIILYSIPLIVMIIVLIQLYYIHQNVQLMEMQLEERDKFIKQELDTKLKLYNTIHSLEDKIQELKKETNK